MATIYDVNANELIEKTAVELKKVSQIKPPQWASFAKTGMHKQRPPIREDWWYTRTAAVLRSIYKLGPVGVSKLRTKYGGKRDRGHKPEHFFKGSGAIIRKICQQLESAELIKQTKIGVRKGRVVTPKGQSFMDKIASQILGKPIEPLEPVVVKPKKEKPVVVEEQVVEEKKPEPKKEPKVEEKKKPEEKVKAEKQPTPEEVKKKQDEEIKKKVGELKKQEELAKKKQKNQEEIKKVEELAAELQKKGTLRKEGKKKKKNDVPTTHELAAKKKKAK